MDDDERQEGEKYKKIIDSIIDDNIDNDSINSSNDDNRSNDSSSSNNSLHDASVLV